MDGWNFIEGPSEPRSILRETSECVDEVSIRERIDRLRRVIVAALRDFPEAYRAVVDALYRMEEAERTG